MTNAGPWLFLYAVLAGLVGFWNQSRGHSFATAFLISMIGTPVLGALVVLFTKRKKRGEKKR